MSWEKKRVVVETIDTSASFSTDTSNHEIVCGAGKRIKLLSFAIDPDNNASLSVYIKDASDVGQDVLMAQAATTAAKYWPADGTTGSGEGDKVLLPGEYIHFVFGAAQGAGTLIVTKYYEVDL